MELKTPLYDTHIKYGGKIVPFAGYLLPVQYEKGVIAEHMAVRTGAGLFDVSHMGEILCTGKDSLDFLNYLLTNDFTNMTDGQARYSPMCNDDGGTVDDLIVYKYKDGKYFIVVNAANKDKDYKWICSHKTGDVNLEDISDKVCQLALQGPRSYDILHKLASDEYIPEKYYHAVFDAQISGFKCIISQTGYTGESGYEIYISNESAAKLWDIIIDAGNEYGILPCGLGARDTLRLEAAMPLYGHEMDDTIDPIEAGLGFAVKMKKDNFIGKAAIAAKGEAYRKRVGLKAVGRGIIREYEDIFADGKKIGRTTSGTYCPYLGYSASMAMIEKEYSQIGTRVTADVRGRMVEAEVVSLPFYKKNR